LLTVLRRETPVKIAQEALWRTRKRWLQLHLPERLEGEDGAVTFRPAGYFQPDLEHLDHDSRALTLRYADMICQGQFPWFAYGPVELGFPPRWDFDFVSGSHWPKERAGAIQVVRRDGSDVKVPWDLSRLQFLPVLGKAWLLNRDERYRQAGTELLSDWMEKNPVGIGVNWTIAMEVALRAVSICLFLELLANEGSFEPLQMRRFAACLWKHLLFIEDHNEFSYLSRSNHYLSNIVGLFFLSVFLEGPGIQARRQLYRKLVEQEIRQQVYEDGGNHEASTGYHVLVLQMLTSALVLMRAQSMEPSVEFASRLQQMYEWLATLADNAGRVPQFGDCDDGRVELLSDDLRQMLVTNPGDRNSLFVSGLLGIGEAAFGKNYGGRRADAAWYGNLIASQHARPSAVLRRPAITFSDSGIAVARNREAEIIFLAMPNGIEGKGSHTHNDKLSLITRIKGEDFLEDCGTGCYTRDANLRNRLRSTAAHNTVQIDRAEQNRLPKSSDDLFRICNDAHVSTIRMQEVDGAVVLQASHDGYCRLGVSHTRTVTLVPQGGIVLEDELAGSGTHVFEAFFHVSRRWQVAPKTEEGKEVSCCIHGSCAVEICCSAPVVLKLSCIPGIIAKAYGAVAEGTTIRIQGSFDKSVKLAQRISWQA